MKHLNEIYQSIKTFFENKVKNTVEQGSVLDLFMLSVSNEMNDAYEYIASNKTPHIYTSLNGQNLDDMVKFCGFTRREGESDQNLLYRLINWSLINEKSNTIAIDAALLDLKNVTSPSLYIEYVTPELRAITLSISISNSDSNLADIKRNLEIKLAEYINAIPPKESLDIGYINKLGINETGVSYFNVSGLFVDGVSVTNLKVLQDIKSKMLLDTIQWIEV